MLSDNEARAPAFGSRSFLYFPGRDVAAKTGTTNDYRDAWIVGYTPNIAVGAWAGNNDNSPMDKRVAGFIIAPLWNEFMYRAFEKYPDEKFRQPQPLNEDQLKPILKGIWRGGSSYTIDTVSGKLATQYTPIETREERFVEDINSILHWVDKDDPRGPTPANPANDPQYRYWQYAVEQWKIENGYVSTSTGTSSIPTEFDDVHLPEYRPEISLPGLNSNVNYLENELIQIIPDIEEKRFPIQRVDYYLNNTLIESVNTPPFTLTFRPNTVDSLGRINTLTAIVFDEVFNKGEVRTNLRIAN
jgi:membrane carboxypeptidase/penicillin-binding protein PbpC